MSTQAEYNANYAAYVLYYIFQSGNTTKYNMYLSNVCSPIYDGSNNIQLTAWQLGTSPSPPSTATLLTYTLATVTTFYNNMYANPAASVANQPFVALTTAQINAMVVDSSYTGYYVFDTTTQSVRIYNGTSWVTNAQTFLPLVGGTMTGPLNMGAQSITNVSAIRPSTTNVVIGNSASAVSTNSVAIGESAIISGGTGSAVIIGQGATSAGGQGVTIGATSSASGGGCVIIGQSANTTGGGTGGVVIGQIATASGNFPVTVGYQSTAGDAAVAMGYQASANAAQSISIGPQSTASAKAIVIGDGSTSLVTAGDVFGSGQTNTTPSSLLLGNGAYVNIRANTGCDLGTTAARFASAFLSGSVAGPTNTRSADDILSCSTAQTAGNLLSFSGSAKVAVDSTVVAANVVTNAGTSANGRIAVFSGVTGKLITDGGSTLSQYLLLAGGTMTGSLNMGTQTITNVASIGTAATNILIGNSTSATSNNNVIVGATATTTGTGSNIVIGSGSTSSADQQVVIGQGITSAAGSNLICIGGGAANTGGGANVVLIGRSSVATGTGGIGIGSSATTVTDSVVIGRGALAQVTGSTIIGTLSTSGNVKATAFGSGNTVSAANADIFGSGVTNSTANSLLLGNGSYVNIRANTGCDLGTSAIPFANAFIGTSVVSPALDTSAALTIGGTNATSLAIGRSTVTSTINGIFVATTPKGAWYSSSTYNPSFAANTNRLTPPTVSFSGTLTEFTQTLGVLSYTGTRTRTFKVEYNITFTSGASGTNMTFFNSKNGSTVIGTSQTQMKQQITANLANTQQNTTFVDFVTLATNDTVQLAGACAVLTAAVGYNFVSCVVTGFND